jgi:hypothetical protein
MSPMQTAMPSAWLRLRRFLSISTSTAKAGNSDQFDEDWTDMHRHTNVPRQNSDAGKT